MEVKSADDYIHVYGADVDGEHPHGDLDRIIIDGQIMPLRNNPPNKTPLRGEDIAFLAEAVLEREKFFNDWFEDSQFKFSRKITAGPAYAATPLGVVQAFSTDLGIHEDGYGPTGLVWFKPGKSWSEGPVGTEQFSAFDPSLFLSKKDITIPVAEIRSGKPVKRSNISAMFDSVAKLTRIGVPHGYWGDEFWSSWQSSASGSWEPGFEPGRLARGEFYVQAFNWTYYYDEQGEIKWHRTIDYVNRATSAVRKFRLQKLKYAKRATLWGVVGLSGNKWFPDEPRDSGRNLFVRGSRLLRLGDMTITGDEATIDLSTLSGRAESLLASIGYTPSRRSEEEAYTEWGTMDVVRYLLELELRDRTRW